MAYSDRDYGRGGDGGWAGGGDLFGRTSALLGYSMPFGSWGPVRVRLHFWLLVSIVFLASPHIQAGQWGLLGMTLLLLLAALLLHELGHRLAAHWVGGSHDEFVLWPAGGMVPPNAPLRPGATFIAHGAGMATNLLLAGLCAAGIAFLGGQVSIPFVGPLEALGGRVGRPMEGASGIIRLLGLFMGMNLAIFMTNLLPFYWFDGGQLLQAMLWPFAGLYRAVNVTCIIGMVIAGPMMVLSLVSFSLFGLVFWGWLLTSAYMRRQQLLAEGPAQLAVEASLAGATGRGSGGGWWARRRARQIAREAERERREQARVDAILAKVHEKGMGSLTWWERRVLRQATRRQQRRDAARETRLRQTTRSR